MTVGRLLALDPDPASQRTAFQLSALLEPPNLSKMDGTSTESCTIHNGVTQLSIDPINSHASYFGKSTGHIKDVCRLIEPCLQIGTKEYTFSVH